MSEFDRFGWERALFSSALPTPAKITGISLRLHADADGRSWPSVATIAAETSQSRRTVQQALRTLETAGWIQPQGFSPSTVYLLKEGAQEVRPDTRSSACGAQGAHQVRGGGASGARGGRTTCAGGAHHMRGGGACGAPKQTIEQTIEQNDDASRATPPPPLALLSPDPTPPPPLPPPGPELPPLPPPQVAPVHRVERLLTTVNPSWRGGFMQAAKLRRELEQLIDAYGAEAVEAGAEDLVRRSADEAIGYPVGALRAALASRRVTSAPVRRQPRPGASSLPPPVAPPAGAPATAQAADTWQPHPDSPYQGPEYGRPTTPGHHSSYHPQTQTYLAWHPQAHGGHGGWLSREDHRALTEELKAGSPGAPLTPTRSAIPSPDRKAIA